MMKRLYAMALAGAFVAQGAAAQDLVYTPINPSFGGNSFNSGHLLGIAEIDRPDEPEGAIPSLFDTGLSQAEQFAQQLENRILAQLSFDIVDRIFNGTAQTGVFEFDQTTLSFERLLDGSIQLAIFDATTGSTTNILVPAFLTQSTQP